jgi:hypothetical protein
MDTKARLTHGARTAAGWARRHPRWTACLGFFALLAVAGACQPQAPRASTAAPIVAAPAEPTPAPPTPVPTAPPAPTPTRTVVPYPTFAPSMPVQREPVGPTGGKCADYPSQAEAQAALRRDPVKAGRLDDDRDGIACESNPAPSDRAPVARPARP